MSTLPEWMYPPRIEGWYADDLDRLPEAPRHTELIDGALIFMMSPQRSWHNDVIFGLRSTLEPQAPAGVRVKTEMAVRLDRRNRPEPDLLLTTAPEDRDRTWFDPSDVLLVGEVVSPESEDRDRDVKPRKYAAAGIAHYWRVEEEADGSAVIYVYELDPATASYVPVGIARDRLQVSKPFPITVDVAGLYP